MAKRKAKQSWNWRSLLGVPALVGGAIVGTGIVVGFVMPLVIGLWNSGPLPVPSRAEVTVVDSKVNTLHLADDQVHMQLTDQLKQQATSLAVFAAQQKSDNLIRLTNQVRNLQKIIESAGADYMKNPTPDNQRVLDTLQAQMTELQRQIMESAK